MLIANNGNVLKILSKILSTGIFEKNSIGRTFKILEKYKRNQNIIIIIHDRYVYMPSIYSFHHMYELHFI